MTNSSVNTRLMVVDSARWQKVLWVSAVLLTLGLCLLAWKRPVTEEVFAVEPTVAIDAQLREVAQAPAMVVIKVRSVRHLPVWASAVSEVGIITEEYPQPRLDRVA